MKDKAIAYNVVWYSEDGSRSNQIVSRNRLEKFLDKKEDDGLTVKSVMEVAK